MISRGFVLDALDNRQQAERLRSSVARDCDVVRVVAAAAAYADAAVAWWVAVSDQYAVENGMHPGAVTKWASVELAAQYREGLR